MIRAPGVQAGSRRSNALVETIDLYPTLVELCQPAFLKTEHTLDGVSLVPILTGEADSVREAAVSYWRSTVSVRTEDFRLIQGDGRSRKKAAVELYRVSEGPDPVNNLARTKPDVVQRLQALVPRRIDADLESGN